MDLAAHVAPLGPLLFGPPFALTFDVRCHLAREKPNAGMGNVADQVVRVVDLDQLRLASRGQAI
eukprot:6350336-Pyramimonas_sp.AAC.1